jgi:hypothetical protein
MSRLTNCVGGRFIPGIGWLGLDPSHGIFTGILIFQLLQVRTSRIRCQFGGIRGSATSKLLTQLSIEKQK